MAIADKKVNLDKQMNDVVGMLGNKLENMRKIVANAGGVAAMNAELGAGEMDDLVTAYGQIKTFVDANKTKFAASTSDLTA